MRSLWSLKYMVGENVSLPLRESYLQLQLPPSLSLNLTKYMPAFLGKHFLNVQHSLFQVPQTTS